MGIKDTVTIKYMKQNEIFADAFNYFIYNGEQVIKPDCLEELDTREIGVPYGGEKGEKQPVQKARDIIKTVTAMTDKRTAYLLLAIENQSNIHYAMPVKNLVYDALQYAKQVERAISSHKKSGDYKEAGSDEYLSGFMKEDRLMPVVTLTVYFGAKKWDGPMCVHEMFGEQDERVLALVPDYKINLLAPASVEENDFDKFQTTLKEVMKFIKYSEDADKLEEAVRKDEKFLHLGRNEVDVLNTCVSANLAVHEDEEVIDVCGAIQTIADRAAKRATEQTRINTLLDNINNLMEKMGWSAEQAMDMLGIPEDERELLASQINS